MPTKNRDRRSFLVGTAALGVMAALPVSLNGASRSTLSPLETFARLRCGAPGQRAWWWYSGHVLGRVFGEPAVPMLSVSGVSVSRCAMRDDGGIGYELREAGYYGDPQSGEIADRWTNPLNGRSVEAVHYLSGQKLVFTPDLEVRPDMPNLPEGLDYTGRIIGPDVKQGRIWMAEELFVGLPSSGETRRTANSLANFEARVSDVTDASLAFVPTTMEYTTINSFRPWMEMGDTPGTISMRLNGVKMPDPDAIPASLRARIDQDHPDFFATFDSGTSS